MISIVQQPAEDRAALFQYTANELNINEAIIEDSISNQCSYSKSLNRYNSIDFMTKSQPSIISIFFASVNN